MAVAWSRRAEADLSKIFSRIAVDNRPAAERWVARLIERVEDAREAPLLGRIVPELGRAEIRETYLRTYRIVYRADETGVCVLTLFEGSRLLRRSDVDEP